MQNMEECSAAGKEANDDVWKDPPAVRFMKRLVRERAVDLMGSDDYLRSLRHRNDVAVSDQRRFGHIWQEYGTNVYQLIAGAHGETWDAEDEQKEAFRAQKKEPPVNQRALALGDNDNLATTCEESPRRWIDELQGKPEEGLGLLEKTEGQLGGEAQEETRKEEVSRSRGFYRRAGGGCPSP